MNMGKNLIRNLAELDALAAVCDPDDRLAQLYAGLHPVENLTFAEILASPAIEGVVLAVPAPLHASMALDAMNAGKHTFVKKPLAMNMVEGESMIAAAKKNAVRLMVGHLLPENVTRPRGFKRRSLKCVNKANFVDGKNLAHYI